MKSRLPKRLFIILLCLFIVISIYIICDFRKLQISLSLKINWDMSMPYNDIIYNCYTNKVNYYVCKIPIQQQDKLNNQLIKQDLNPASVNEVIYDLEEIKVDKDKYPIFESINYSIKKTRRLSHLYLLYSSNSSILYIIEYLD